MNMKIKNSLFKIGALTALLLIAANIAAGASVDPVVIDNWASGDAATECSIVKNELYCDCDECKSSYKFDGWTAGDKSYNGIEITNNDGKSFNWKSSSPVYAVIVKAAKVANIYCYDGAYSDTVLVGYDNKDISHVTFCYGEAACSTGSITGKKTNGCTNALVSDTTITLYESDGKTLVDIENNPTETGDDGTYTFAGLLPGSYVVCETVPEGMYSYDASGNIVEAGYEVCQTVTVGCGATATANFKNYPLLTISGTKTNGCNDDAVSDTTITLYESDGKTLVDIENNPTETGDDGTYTFVGLLPGSYVVCETVPEGMYSKDASGNIVEAGDEVCIDVELKECTGQVNPANFVNYPLLTISGTKTNGCTNAPVSGTTITLYESDGTTPVDIENNPTTTVSDGSYTFAGLLPGTYVVCETVPDGMYSKDASGNIVEAGDEVCIDVELKECTGQVNPANFVNYPLLSISGKKVNDVTGAGMAGWTINLFKSSDLTTPIDSYTTLSDGSYKFEGLLLGSYKVCEVLEDGWQAVSPTCVDVTLTDCQSQGGATGVNFVNQRCETAWGFPGGDTFIGSGISTNWGWYEQLFCDDLLAVDGYTDDLIAGAGQNVVEKGTYVGKVNAKIDNYGNLVLTYDVDPNYILTTIQAYASNTKMTSANPGGFAFKDETGGNVLTIPLSGSIKNGNKVTPYTLDCTKGIYIAMHADVCWRGL